MTLAVLVAPLLGFCLKKKKKKESGSVFKNTAVQKATSAFFGLKGKKRHNFTTKWAQWGGQTEEPECSTCLFTINST